MLSGALPVLLTVTVCALDATFSVWLKLNAVGDKAITGIKATPVPDKPALLLKPAALWVMVRLALREPAALGVKLTFTVQLPPAATEPPATHVPPLTVKSALAVDNVPRLSAALPVLFKVTVCAVLVLPTFKLPKPNAAEMLATGAAAGEAVPLRPALPGLPAALCATVNVPLRAPAAPVGTMATLTTQLLPAATVPPATHVPPTTANSALAEMDEITKPALPLLLTEMFCEALVPPMAVEASVNDAGDTDAMGAGTTGTATPVAVPVKAMATGVNVPACAIDKLPVRAPAAVGVNATITVHDKPVPTAVPQVPPWRVKSPLVLTLIALMG
jgi:hypothetical protein